MFFGRIVKFGAPLFVIYKIREAQHNAKPQEEHHE